MNDAFRPFVPAGDMQVGMNAGAVFGGTFGQEGEWIGQLEMNTGNSNGDFSFLNGHNDQNFHGNGANLDTDDGDVDFFGF